MAAIRRARRSPAAAAAEQRRASQLTSLTQLDPESAGFAVVPEHWGMRGEEELAVALGDQGFETGDEWVNEGRMQVEIGFIQEDYTAGLEPTADQIELHQHLAFAGAQVIQRMVMGALGVLDVHQQPQGGGWLGTNEFADKKRVEVGKHLQVAGFVQGFERDKRCFQLTGPVLAGEIGNEPAFGGVVGNGLARIAFGADPAAFFAVQVDQVGSGKPVWIRGLEGEDKDFVRLGPGPHPLATVVMHKVGFAGRAMRPAQLTHPEMSLGLDAGEEIFITKIDAHAFADAGNVINQNGHCGGIITEPGAGLAPACGSYGWSGQPLAGHLPEVSNGPQDGRFAGAVRAGEQNKVIRAALPVVAQIELAVTPVGPNVEQMDGFDAHGNRL